MFERETAVDFFRSRVGDGKRHFFVLNRPRVFNSAFVTFPVAPGWPATLRSKRARDTKPALTVEYDSSRNRSARAIEFNCHAVVAHFRVNVFAAPDTGRQLVR